MSEGRGIVFLQKDKFDFYTPSIARVVEFRFVPEIIRDLEVVNSELLENLVKLFVTSNKAVSGELIIVMADNTSFVRDFGNPVPLQPQPSQAAAQPAQPPVAADQAKKIDEEISDFIENVPFENVAYKKFPITNGLKVLATNKDFFMAVKKAFEKAGFRIGGVFPGIVFGSNVSSKQTLDIVAVNIINQQADMQKANNLLVEEKKPQTQEFNDKKNQEMNDFVVPEQETREKPKTNKKRIIAMLAVFGVLIIILIYMVINPPS